MLYLNRIKSNKLYLIIQYCVKQFCKKSLLINLALLLLIFYICLALNNKTVISNQSVEIIKLNKRPEEPLDPNFKKIKDSFANLTPKLCELDPRGLIGKFDIEKPPENFNSLSKSVDKTLAPFLKNLEFGGSYAPVNCEPRHRVAIVLPYRDRLDNLNWWLYNMHPFLQRQELAYTVFVVEQSNDELFNKGIIMNAAFNLIFEGNSSKEYDCIIYHDVDMIPSDDLNIYGCSDKPRHFSIIVGSHNYLKEYRILVGGVMAYRPSHYRALNGYSNMFWGWGAEDDNMYYRLIGSNINFERPLRNTNYTMLKHESRYKNPDRVKIMSQRKPFKKDGLSNVKYSVENIVQYSMHTHFSIDPGKPVPFVTSTKAPRINMKDVRES